LAEQYAAKHYKIKDDEVDDVIKKLKKKLNTEDAYKNFLKKYGYTEKSLRKEIVRRLQLQRAFKDEIDNKVKYDQKEAKKEYEKKKKTLFTIPPKIEVDDIYIPIGKDKKAALKKANKIADKVKELKTTARLSSDDRKGIRISTVQVEKKEDAVFYKHIKKLKPQQVSKPFEHMGGYHVLLVRRFIPEKTIPFKKAETWFKQKKKAERMKQWYEELKKGANIKIDKEKIDKLVQTGKASSKKVSIETKKKKK